MPKIEKKEENIEAEILCFFMEKGILAWKNDIKGYYNEKLGAYQKNKSNFIRNGISDITALYQGKHIAIEVKKPSEMNFFDRDLKTLKEEYAKATFRVQNPKKYLHAVEQREFLDDVIKAGGIGFFTSSLQQTKDRLKESLVLI